MVSTNSPNVALGSGIIRTNSVTHAFLSVVSDSLRDKHSTAFEVVSKKLIAV
jgi:hypothetical protein